MKKIFLIFLLLGSVVLPGCGDYEDESPRVVWTTPDKTSTTYPGKSVTVAFNMVMMPETVSLDTVYVIDEASNTWPLAAAEGTTDCKIDQISIGPGIGLEGEINQTFLFDIDDACILVPNSNLTLVVTQNVRSKTGQTLDAPYRVNFTTAPN